MNVNKNINIEALTLLLYGFDTVNITNINNNFFFRIFNSFFY
jgi:hypothetical protein